jgi:hypothetical protein
MDCNNIFIFHLFLDISSFFFTTNIFIIIYKIRHVWVWQDRQIQQTLIYLLGIGSDVTTRPNIL